MTEQAQVVEIADAITYPARVTSKVKATVFAPAEGVITKIHAPLGSQIRAGATLMAIKNTDPLYEYVPIAVETPVTGVVSALEVTPGSKVVKGQALATVIDPKQTGLVVEVPAADLASFVKGLKGTFQLGLSRDPQPIETEVSGISPLVDPLTGTATAELVSAKTGALVPPGTIGKVSFSINKRQGIQVPEQAIVYRGKDTLVRVVAEGKAKMVPVQVAQTRKGLTEVLSGLAAGSAVVVRASGFVADGQAVVVQNGDVAKK
jgi:RND family efflux transporter MFP subunit